VAGAGAAGGCGGSASVVVALVLGQDRAQVPLAEDQQPVGDLDIGPFERTLRDLGVDRPLVLHQGQVIDRAGELLIAEATEGLARKRRRADAAELGKSNIYRWTAADQARR
jgi:hypothetical protein